MYPDFGYDFDGRHTVDPGIRCDRVPNGDDILGGIAECAFDAGSQRHPRPMSGLKPNVRRSKWENERGHLSIIPLQRQGIPDSLDNMSCFKQLESLALGI